jgi:hypothetical protein
MVKKMLIFYNVSRNSIFQPYSLKHFLKLSGSPGQGLSDILQVRLQLSWLGNKSPHPLRDLLHCCHQHPSPFGDFLEPNLPPPLTRQAIPYDRFNESSGKVG